MKELIMVGDRVLILPVEGDRQTQAGLYLPATVTEKERVQTGRVVQIGPGYVMPNPEFSGDPWATDKNAVRYLPLQAKKGDLAFYVKKEAIEIQFEGTEYNIVPHMAIVALLRDPESALDDIDLGDLLGS
jgi:chaperonin GroES